MGMAQSLLEQIEQMVDRLDRADQAKLFEYLAPRVEPKIRQGENKATWKEFLQARDRVAADLKPSDESIVDELSKSRR